MNHAKKLESMAHTKQIVNRYCPQGAQMLELQDKNFIF